MRNEGKNQPTDSFKDFDSERKEIECIREGGEVQLYRIKGRTDFTQYGFKVLRESHVPGVWAELENISDRSYISF